MSDSTNYFFYLPPGILKTDQVLDMYYNQNLESFHSIQIIINDHSFPLNQPNLVKEILHWDASDYPDLFSNSSASLSVQIDQQPPINFNFDELTFVSQTEEKLSKDKLPHIILFRFKAGIFARKADYQSGTISIDKVNVLHNQKRLLYEQAIQKNADMNKHYETLCNENFLDLYQRFKAFDETRRNERIRIFNENQKKTENLSVSPFLDQSADDQFLPPPSSSNLQKNYREPFVIEQLEESVTYPQKPYDRSPTAEEVGTFLKELGILFPVDQEERTFCGIKENDPDLQAQKMLCFNLCHYLVLYGAITGVTYDYRFSMCDGTWKIEERTTGNEIKKELMNKSAVFDNPYREAIFSCLKKLAEDLRLPKFDTLIATIEALNTYGKSLLFE